MTPAASTFATMPHWYAGNAGEKDLPAWRRSHPRVESEAGDTPRRRESTWSAST